MSTNLKLLISKLNDTAKSAATRAANLCVGFGHYEVDLEHVLLALLEQPHSDVNHIATKQRVDSSALAADLKKALDGFKTGNTRTPVFSQRFIKLLEHAWLIASLDQHAEAGNHIRSGHLLLALLTEPELSQVAYRSSILFQQFNLEEIKHRLDEITQGSDESLGQVDSERALSAHSHDVNHETEANTPTLKTPALDQFTTNLTQLAREGKVDPVIGRETEIRQLMDVLLRRRQNNPILTGEAGVGKTAVVEGLALRIAHNDVPDVLSGVDIRTLDMGLLQAGASVKGEFEHRLKRVIDEVKKSHRPIILFIDEAHTIIGAGGQAGQNDAANLLKPALARGELRTIAATTWAEYKKYFEKDPALARRFQVVKVEEPSEALACAMLRGMQPLMEQHFHIRIVDEAITEAVRLSNRYITGRQLPDKAVSLLDTACAKVALGQRATPQALEQVRKQLERVESEIQALTRDAAIGHTNAARVQALEASRIELQSEASTLEHQWEQEQTLCAEIQALRTSLEATSTEPSVATTATKATRRSQVKANAHASDASNATHQALHHALQQLHQLQAESPMVSPQVDGAVIAEVVSSWTGIPLGKMIKNDMQTVRHLPELLNERVIGQAHSIDAIAQRVRTARAGLDDPNKPQGVFLFVGPSGVGKTETALALADVLYGGERKLITINMSEYQEAHSVSGLKGSPPGYVGYGEGGVLTEAVRRNPYSVVLLDEVEKAHPDVLELFFQVFDKGVMEDAEGSEVNFKNTIIILTSNVASHVMMQACLNKAVDALPTPDALDALIRPHLMKAFKPAFLGRLKVVPYYPLADDVLIRIIDLKLNRIQARLQANHHARLEYTPAVAEVILARCTEVDSGARNVDAILNGTLLPEIADRILERLADGQGIQSIKVSVNKQGQFKYTVR